MQIQEFKRLMGLVDTLSSEQRSQLVSRLQIGGGEKAVKQMIESRMEGCPCCPHCSATQVVRNGHADGLQRYKCRACSKTFNALSGTSLARLRHREKWLMQANVLEVGLSVRGAAIEMAVHRTTAFRWRHRFLALASSTRATALAGVAEADETYQLRSYKGQPRRLRAEQSREARHRGGKAAKRGLSDEQIPILVLRDRAGQTADFVLERANVQQIKPVLAQSLADDAILCTDASVTLAAAARACALEHQAVNTSAGEHRRGPWHIQNVNAYHSRFKHWLCRFYGVATSYLENYLGWFRALDRHAQIGSSSPAMLALALGI